MKFRREAHADRDADKPFEVVLADHADVVGGAARDDVDVPESVYIVRADGETVKPDFPVAQIRGDRAADGLRLLVDLLEHEVGVAALLGGGHVPVDVVARLFDRAAVFVKDLDAAPGQDGHLAVLHVRYGARVRDDRRHVRRDEAAPLAVADEKRRVLAGGDDPIRRIGAEDAEGVGPLEAVEHLIDRVHDVVAVVEEVFKKLRDDLRIGIGGERDAPRQKKFFYMDVIFDDAVVDDRDPSVLADMGMGVYIVRLAVGGPARVADAGAARHGGALRQPAAQLGHIALAFFDLQAALAIHDGDAGRVVAPVLEAFQTVKQNGSGVLRSDKSHDTAHIIPSLSFRVVGGSAQSRRPHSVVHTRSV